MYKSSVNKETMANVAKTLIVTSIFIFSGSNKSSLFLEQNSPDQYELSSILLHLFETKLKKEKKGKRNQLWAFLDLFRNDSTYKQLGSEFSFSLQTPSFWHTRKWL